MYSDGINEHLQNYHHNELYYSLVGQDRTLRMTSTIRDAQSCELSQGLMAFFHFRYRYKAF